MADQLTTVTEAARALRAGEVTSVGLTQAAIAAADRLDEALGVYVTRLDDAALEAAEHADRELAAGRDRGPLHGVPIGVKDLIAVGGVPTTAQSLALDPQQWALAEDAPVVARLKAAGAVITGKTTTMELGCGMPDPTKPFPVPRNPWDPERWTGGSSSGSASGVAAGMFLAALGSDTGGSIRMPAAFCGVTGLMPTFGRVPKAGCVPLGPSLDRAATITRSASDAAALLEILAGAHASDPDSVDAPFRDEPRDGDLRGVRIGVVRAEHFPADSDPALADTFDAALDALRERGAELREITLPYWWEMVAGLGVIAFGEGLACHREAATQRWDQLCPGTRALLATGALCSGADYVQAQRVRRIAQAAIGELFAEVDVVAGPTTSVAAPRFDPAGRLDIGKLYPMVHTPYWSMLGNPVLALPMGFTADGLPLSLQLAGPAFGEAAILRVGEAFQQATDWHLRVPPPLDGPPTPFDVTTPFPEMPVPDADTVAAVRTLLAAAALPASDAEIAGFAGFYGQQRAGLDALHAVQAARRAAPALRFRASARDAAG